MSIRHKAKALSTFFDKTVHLFSPLAVYVLTQTFLKFPLAPMGVLAPGSAHARPSAQPPIDMSGNFPEHVSADF